MEDEWIEYYSKKSNLENYFETDMKKYGFVKENYVSGLNIIKF